ncbi:MAG: SDR family NAD(P)-dependent oxidoreductase, partial [Longimicrobiales bacterium]
MSAGTALESRELTGRIALVTGGSRGIGRAIASHLAAGGARVAIVARGEDRAVAAASELPGEGHAGFTCDVASETEVDALVERVESAIGPVDI